MGRPKALVELAGRPLVRSALDALRAGGCSPLVVVVGAAADQVAALLPADAVVVHAADWADGMGASLRAGLATLSLSTSGPDGEPSAALVHLVDLPGVGAAAIGRLALLAGTDVLARAAYDGVPGHPVLIGRAHWDGVAAAALGDAGARGYLADQPALRLVECGDVADPGDVDTPAALRRFGVSDLRTADP